MISYGSAMRFGLNFDKAILPHQQDVDDLSVYIEEEFDKLFNKKVTEVSLEKLRPFIGRNSICQEESITLN